MRFLGILFSTFAVLMSQSCSRHELEKIPVTPNVTFTKDIRPITSTVCVSCHASGSLDFRRYINAFRSKFAIRQRVVVDRTMPLSGSLSDEQRALFRDWVDQGGKE